jgi:hypothetical protein
MLEKLKQFADELRKRGYAVEIGHTDDEMFERYSLIIEKDKTKRDNYYG